MPDIAPDDEAAWSSLRRQVRLDPSGINFNLGTCSPIAVPVQEELTRLRAEQASQPSDFCWRKLPVYLDKARTALSGYLACPERELALVANVTIGLNLAVWSLDLPPGSEIVATDHEYGAMRQLLDHSAAEKGWTVRYAPLPDAIDRPEQLRDALLEGIGPKTRVLFFCHVTSPSGLVFPAAEICAAARERGVLTVIDGAHAPGMIPVDLGAIGADYYSANCHKWMNAPLGSAFLHVREEHRAGMKPRITSWGWEYDAALRDQDSGWGGTFWHRHLEFHGTLDRCAQCALPAVIAHRTAIGEEAIRARQLWLAGRIRARLSEQGLRPAFGASVTGALVPFEAPAVDTIRARNYFWQRFRIEAPVTTAAGRYYWRFSAAWFNTCEEIERLADVASRVPWDELK